MSDAEVYRILEEAATALDGSDCHRPKLRSDRERLRSAINSFLHTARNESMHSRGSLRTTANGSLQLEASRLEEALKLIIDGSKLPSAELRKLITVALTKISNLVLQRIGGRAQSRVFTQILIPDTESGVPSMRILFSSDSEIKKREVPIGHSVTGKLFSSYSYARNIENDIYFVPDVSKEPDYQGLIVTPVPIESELAIMIRWGLTPIGVLNFESTNGVVLADETTQTRLRDFAQRIALHVALVRLQYHLDVRQRSEITRTELIALGTAQPLFVHNLKNLLMDAEADLKPGIEAIRGCRQEIAALERGGHWGAEALEPLRRQLSTVEGVLVGAAEDLVTGLKEKVREAEEEIKYGRAGRDLYELITDLNERDDLQCPLNIQFGPKQVVVRLIGVSDVVETIMSNVREHSHCSQLVIDAERGPENIRVRFIDNGVGIPDGVAWKIGDGQRSWAARKAEVFMDSSGQNG